jgi:hypothetical protein
MARRVGSTLDGLAEFAWTEDHGDSGVVGNDFVGIASYAEIPAFQRLHYMFGFHSSSYSGGGQDPRGALFGAFAASLHDTFFGLFDMPMREAWAEANEIVEGSGVEWAYLRATSPVASTYGERLRAAEPTDPVTDRTFYTARGSC